MDTTTDSPAPASSALPKDASQHDGHLTGALKRSQTMPLQRTLLPPPPISRNSLTESFIFSMVR